MDLHIDEDYVVRALERLVRIDSVNPVLVPGAKGESEVAAFIAGELRSAGLDTSIDEVSPGRPNVVGVLGGNGGGASLMLNGHMDTVGVEGMREPFGAVVREGRLYGRGAQDMKGGLAAMLGAVKALARSGASLRGDVIFAAVVDEEHGSIGTEALVRRFTPLAAIVTEPTGLETCIAHKGFAVFEVETTGRAAHGARYMEGIDANLHMGRLLARLDEHASRLLAREPHALLGPPSMHVPLLCGGTHQFVYADRCRASVERRTLPGESASDVVVELEEIVHRLSTDDLAFKCAVRKVMSRDAYEISRDAPIVRLVGDAAERLLGRRPAFIGHDWWEDAALIAASGTGTVIVGPTGGGLHTAEEWVDVRSVVLLAQLLADCAVAWCA